MAGVDEDDTPGTPSVPGPTAAVSARHPRRCTDSRPGRITVTWAAPTVSGTHPVGGYEAGYGQEGWGDSPAKPPPTCSRAPARPFGGDLHGGRGRRRHQGQRGISSAVAITSVMPFPAAVPTSNGPDPGGRLSDKVVAGKTMVVSGTGYQPFSTVTVLITPRPRS